MDKFIEETMKALVIFDTNHGNTKLVADSIAGQLDISYRLQYISSDTDEKRTPE